MPGCAGSCCAELQMSCCAEVECSALKEGVCSMVSVPQVPAPRWWVPASDCDLREDVGRMKGWHGMVERCWWVVELVDEGADLFDGKVGGSVFGHAAGGLRDVSTWIRRG